MPLLLSLLDYGEYQIPKITAEAGMGKVSGDDSTGHAERCKRWPQAEAENASWKSIEKNWTNYTEKKSERAKNENIRNMKV